MAVAFDRFIEAKRGNAIDFCQIAIKDDPSAADSVFVNWSQTVTSSDEAPVVEALLHLRSQIVTAVSLMRLTTRKPETENT